VSASATEKQRIAQAGYAEVMIGSMIHPQLNKRFLRRPYLKYGQCPALWGYLFELGGILVAKHITQLGAFASAFLGGERESAAVEADCANLASVLVSRGRVNGSMRFFEYVQVEFLEKVPGYKGAALEFFLKHGTDKLWPESVAKMAWHFARQGVAVGAIYPELIRAMFERTYAARSKQEWELAYAAGLNIPPEQPRSSYEEAEEVEEVENKGFMDYCREFRPDVYSSLMT
jgi:hypothetical protein